MEEPPLTHDEEIECSDGSLTFYTSDLMPFLFEQQGVWYAVNFPDDFITHEEDEDSDYLSQDSEAH